MGDKVDLGSQAAVARQLSKPSVVALWITSLDRSSEPNVASCSSLHALSGASVR